MSDVQGMGMCPLFRSLSVIEIHTKWNGRLIKQAGSIQVVVLPDLVICYQLGYFSNSFLTKKGILATFPIEIKTSLKLFYQVQECNF